MFIASLPLYKKLSGLRSEMLARKVTPFIRQHSKVLDFGCGNMFTARMISDLVPGLEIIGVDVVADQNLLIDPDKYPKLAFVQSDSPILPFEDETFDHALALACLHHTDHPEAYLEELARVTKPGGSIIIVEEMFINKLDRWYIAGSDYLLNRLKAGIPVPLNFRSHNHYIKVFKEQGREIDYSGGFYLFPTFMHHYLYVLNV